MVMLLKKNITMDSNILHFVLCATVLSNTWGISDSDSHSLPLATSPKPLASKITFGLVRVPVHFNTH